MERYRIYVIAYGDIYDLSPKTIFAFYCHWQ